MAFEFELNEKVQIAVNRTERGTVLARAEYLTCEPSYLVIYVNGNGNTTEKWWGESALEKQQSQDTQ